jgi:multicomponent Na+:H+ antiporter subunit E
MLTRVVTFIIMFGFWLVFSGIFDAYHMTLGAICSALVALVSHDLLFKDISGGEKLKQAWRLILYLPWLIYQVILANLHVVRMVLQPSKIHPQIIEIDAKLKSEISKVTFANSITLTPGTITMDIDGNKFYVHALSQKVADDLLTGEMEDRVAHVYYEK